MKNKTLKTSFVGFGLLMTLLLLPLATRAVSDEGKFLEISPAIFRLKYGAGDAAGKTLTLKNRGPEPLAYRAYFVPLRGDWSANNFRELDSWVSFDDNRVSFLLPPFSEKTLRFSIQVPPGTSSGGYYGQIKLEPLIGGGAAKSDLQIVPVFAVPLLVDVLSQGERQNGSLILENLELEEKMDLPPLEFVFNKIFRVPEVYAANPLVLMEKSPFRFWVTVKNAGKFLTHAGGRLKVFDSQGNELAANTFSEITLLPDERRVLSAEADLGAKHPFWFIYPQRLKAVVEVSDNKEEFLFWVFSWKRSLTVVLSVLCLIVLFHWRARFLAALTALLRA